MSTSEAQILTVISLILVGVQAYFVYRIDRAKLKIERYTAIGEKCELQVKPMIQGGTNEIITVANKGTLPIEETKVDLDLTVKRRNEADLYLHHQWGLKTLLSPDETITIPLHEKLWDFLTKNNLTKLIKGPTYWGEDPETGEDVEDTIYIAYLVKPFSIMLDIQVESKVQDQTNTTRKKYQLIYDRRDELFPDDEDNYEIKINRHEGEWIS